MTIDYQDSNELFEIFSADGVRLGQQSRQQVHAQGHWHRSAQLFLFNTAGELLVHQRAETKDLYAGLWDNSIGEHLQPGESYTQGAQRGALEELGLDGLDLKPLGRVRAQEFKDPAGVWWDRELLQSYCAEYEPGQHGQLRLQANEVAQAAYWNAAMLRRWIAQRSHQLTPWFVDDVHRHNLLPI